MGKKPWVREDISQAPRAELRTKDDNLAKAGGVQDSALFHHYEISHTQDSHSFGHSAEILLPNDIVCKSCCSKLIYPTGRSRFHVGKVQVHRYIPLMIITIDRRTESTKPRRS